ncbi:MULTISPECIES: non-hydrolyzing UDP-N-acetylglucosamine 2-epimerase [unclassified Mycobacterium]|uniref:non-hydrolyzing UDP-N-acetylglucosamine 2-epimerase n=1 Tax=unclassified Mycobacterium TaxID=2642494 RepID=UPI0029C6B1DA|nr:MULTISPECIES: UDP-N-acetylglucosamine 2-epimerase (non-hydrolyzing) [unclassified Mycobacterium]
MIIEDRPTVWLVGGTRPEALKIAPVFRVLRCGGVIRPVLVSTGQHPTMFHQGLAAFGLVPDHELELRRDTGAQAELVAQLIDRLDRLISDDEPDAVLVQGDTATALAGALAAFWRQIPVVHLEAGLRSHDLTAPFPEEANRRMIDQIATLHLAPTEAAATNLRADGISPASIHVTGNTIVDAVLSLAGRTTAFTEPGLAAVEPMLSAGQRLMLVTAHRRESWGAPLRAVLAAVRDVIDAHPDVFAVLPTHPNPVVRDEVRAALGGHRRVLLTPPVDYPDLVRLLERATLVLSDSGGIQEEAPSFGVPVLVLRECTERMEAVRAGCAVLVGTDRSRITREARRLLGTRTAAGPGSRPNPFGDGHAAQRTAIALARLLDVAKPHAS